jgi:hypothetical protein
MRSRCRLCVCACVSPQPLPGNGWVKVSLSLLGNCYFFNAVRVVSKESRRLVLSKTWLLFYGLLKGVVCISDFTALSSWGQLRSYLEEIVAAPV